MFVYTTVGFVYTDAGSKLAKSLFKSVNCLDAFDLLSDYRIGEAFFSGCWLCFALWDDWTKMRKALINKLDIIIYL